MDGELIEDAGEDTPPNELLAELDTMWQNRVGRRGTLQEDLAKTKQMLAKIEMDAGHKQEVEEKVTTTVRRASVMVSPERTAEAISELAECRVSSDECAKAVNETWTKRLHRRSSLIDDIGSTKGIMAQLAGSSDSAEATEKLEAIQEMIAKLEACDEAEYEAIMMIQEMWACQDVKSPTFQEDLEMTKA